MSVVLAEKVAAELAQFSSETRLYGLSIDDDAACPGVGELLVEAFAAHDAVQGVGWRDLIVLSLDAHLPLEPMLGKQATLHVSLAGGDRTGFTGDITDIAMLGSDGGLARYRLRLSPWLWRLGQVRNCRVWQDKTIVEIVDSVFAVYLPLAQWRWSDDTRYFMQDAVPLAYCCQYRESDLDFVERLLSETGLCWRVEQCEQGPGLVLFADSRRLTACPEDPSSEAEGGVRFHRAGACERHDTVQSLCSTRTLGASISMVLSYDLASKKVVAASAPSNLPHGRRLPPLEVLDTHSQDAYADSRHARRCANLQMERHEALCQMWKGRSTLRSLRAGRRLTVLGTPLKQLGATPAFTVLRVLSVGVNNMPPTAQQALAELFGPIPELLRDIVHDEEQADVVSVIEQARETGYANCFEALPVEVVWRPQSRDNNGRGRPTAPGSQTAIVVGADGSSEPVGADELYCDRLGRVRIRFHWQDEHTSCWVRVAQRFAGEGIGFQLLPRIGTEVLVKFLEGDIDRPVIVGALYNGQGEGGIAPTPGGRLAGMGDTSVFAKANDHAVSGQGNLAGGNSPVWHGASGDSAGHRNGAAQWGIRSKEFGGSRYNQLVFDDTDACGRVQLASSRINSELNLGHLIHSADNYRGSFRGWGAELRTDAYGATRAGAGFLITSHAITHTADHREPAGANAAGIAMSKQGVMLKTAFNSAAVTHKTVAFPPPVDADATHLDISNGTRAQASDKRIGISAQAGLGVGAGQSLQVAAGETATASCAQDSKFITGGSVRKHTGQAIGVLGGAVQGGEGQPGLQLTAAKDAVELQALRDTLAVQARDEVNVMSANSHIDWAAAKSILMATAGGASIRSKGGISACSVRGDSPSGQERRAWSILNALTTCCHACRGKSAWSACSKR